MAVRAIIVNIRFPWVGAGFCAGWACKGVEPWGGEKILRLLKGSRGATGGSPHGLQTPCKQLPFSGSGGGIQRTLLTQDFLYSTMTFLSDAPLAQLDRALDFGSSGRGFESLRARHFSTPYADRPFPETTDWMVFV